jgi:hypothetical protein
MKTEECPIDKYVCAFVDVLGQAFVDAARNLQKIWRDYLILQIVQTKNFPEAR